MRKLEAQRKAEEEKRKRVREEVDAEVKRKQALRREVEWRESMVLLLRPVKACVLVGDEDFSQSLG